MNALLIPLAYKYVAIALMVAEINYCSQKLQLPLDGAVTGESLQLVHVSNPYVTGFGGTLETTNYSFIFFKDGRLHRVQRINRFEAIPLRELQLKQARMNSLIDTNGAYQLATNWLSAISVDVPALESSFPSSVEQRFFYPDATSLEDAPEKKSRVVLLPIFHVFWGDKSKPVIMVSIFGPTKEMLGIYQNDDSFSRRPKELLKDVQILLNIPNQEFQKYSDLQKHDLIVGYSITKYETQSVANKIYHSRESQDYKATAQQ